MLALKCLKVKLRAMQQAPARALDLDRTWTWALAWRACVRACARACMQRARVGKKAKKDENDKSKKQSKALETKQNELKIK